MSNIVLTLVGISGVGKTTFLRKASKIMPFQHLSAGTLIAHARNADELPRDELRLAPLDENQRMLASGFDLMRDRQASCVVLDGHVVIHGADGLHHIGSTVFRTLGLDGIVHLTAPPAVILSNRERDSSRERPAISLTELSHHQVRSIAAANEIAIDLGLPFIEITAGQQAEFCSFAEEVTRLVSAQG